MNSSGFYIHLFLVAFILQRGTTSQTRVCVCVCALRSAFTTCVASPRGATSWALIGRPGSISTNQQAGPAPPTTSLLWRKREPWIRLCASDRLADRLTARGHSFCPSSHSEQHSAGVWRRSLTLVGRFEAGGSSSRPRDGDRGGRMKPDVWTLMLWLGPVAFPPLGPPEPGATTLAWLSPRGVS